MRKLLADNMKYPKEAAKLNVEGFVNLRYGIDYKGNVSEVKVLQGLGHGCDEEAERLVRLFKFTVPKTPRRLKVAFHKTIRIHFKISSEKQKTPTKQSDPGALTYTYTIAAKKSQTETPSEKKSSYTYTIKY